MEIILKGYALIVLLSIAIGLYMTSEEYEPSNKVWLRNTLISALLLGGAWTLLYVAYFIIIF